MGWFNTKKEAPKDETENKSFEGFRSIDTEGMDLSQPFVDDYYSRGFQWVGFGEDNSYPQILNQLYISAPMHQACCNFKRYSLIGNGYEWQGYEKLEMSQKIQIRQFETMSNFKEASKKGSLDWIKHGRVLALLHYNLKTKKYDYFKLVEPADFRNNQVSLFNDTPTEYYYSKDWTRRSINHQFKPYSPSCQHEWQIIEIRNNVGGFKAYGMPDWISSANWSNVGADTSLLHKSAIENGIQPSVIYKYPYIMSPVERSDWADGMRQNAKGAKNYGRAMKVESQSKDMTPEIEVVKTTDNHRLFEQTSKEYKEEVAISHNINPALMGVRVAGSLGANEEIEFSAKQFEKIWLSENREIIETFLNKISTICGITQNIKINKTEIIDVVKDEKSAKESANESENFEVSVNDNLKGLSAKENADINRVIRDFKKGRMNMVIAKTRIMSYGIASSVAEEILNAE